MNTPVNDANALASGSGSVSRDVGEVATSSDAPPLAQRDLALLGREYTWLTPSHITSIGEVARALKGVPFEWSPPIDKSRDFDPDFANAMSMTCPKKVARRLREAYECAPGSPHSSAHLRLRFVKTDGLRIIYEVKAATNRVERGVSSDPASLRRQFIDDVLAVHSDIDAAIAIKLVRITEALGDTPLKWEHERHCLSYAKAYMDVTTSIGAIVRDVKWTSARNIASGYDKSVIATVLRGPRWVLCYRANAPHAPISTAKTISTQYPFLDREQLVAVGQVDALLADIPHVWGHRQTEYRSRLDGASVASVVSDVKSRHQALADKGDNCHALLWCCDDGKGQAYLRYTIEPY